jgi:hypothetical protein
MPRPSRRGGTHRARVAAPSLVKPAFVPGWVESCRCRCRRQRARRPPSSLSFPFCVRLQRGPSPPRRVEHRDAFASRACPRARACARHGARTRAPQHARAATVKAKPGLGPSLRAPPRPPSPVLAAPSPRRRRAGLTISPSPCARRVEEYLAPYRTPGQERTGPTSSASLASAHGVEPCAAVAPPRHPLRARAETLARFAQTHQRTPVHAHLHFTPPYPA